MEVICMSRIRTIKPEFWVSEQIATCSRDARLLFIGLWTFCDDAGVHPASPFRLRSEVFPGDGCSLDDINKWINELIHQGLIREYVVEDKPYWMVTGWKLHQRIDKPTYRYPQPQSELKKISDNSTSPLIVHEEPSKSPHRIVDEPSATDRNGMERNGVEIDICEAEASSLIFSDKKFKKNVEEIFRYWQKVMNHPRARLDKKRRAKIEQSLKSGYSLDELKQAIDGCAKTPFNMGQNNQGQRYDGLELILRDAEHIDRFIKNSINPPQPAANPGPNQNINNPLFGAI